MRKRFFDILHFFCTFFCEMIILLYMIMVKVCPYAASFLFIQ